jgi:CheY-like chemotaxis protein
MVTMLNGDINIKSTVDVGTEVTVQFPMTLSSASSSSAVTSGSTPSSAGSIERVKDNSLFLVQQNLRGRKALLFPDAPPAALDSSTEMVRDTVARYLSGWFGLDVITSWSKKSLPDVIILDEADLADLTKALPDPLGSPGGPIIIVLCTPSSRRSEKNIIKSPNLEAVSYPFGPYKLAKSIRVCIEKIERSSVVETEAEAQASGTAPEPDRQDSQVEEIITNVERITMTNSDPSLPDVKVIKSGQAIAHEDSVHANLLVESARLTPSASSGTSHGKNEYPFPMDRLNDGTISPSNLNLGENDRPSLASRHTLSPTSKKFTSGPQPTDTAAPTSSKGAITISPGKVEESEKRVPRLLLVDDNRVNLRLLQTFMKKRAYTDVFSAEDGYQAVCLFQDMLNATPPHPPDIIFMDISMPIMTGFEATRKIREIELNFRDKIANPMETPPSSLIIALTGLASGRDQSEAFTSGFDLYLIKPISFREVSRLLDNWEVSGGAATVGVPHGSLTGSENLPSESSEAFPGTE